jgi:hypothetical protein
MQVDDPGVGAVFSQLGPQNRDQLCLFAILCRGSCSGLGPIHSPRTPAAIKVPLEIPAPGAQRTDVPGDRHYLTVESWPGFLKRGEYAAEREDSRGFVPVQTCQADEPGARARSVPADDPAGIDPGDPIGP